MNPRILFTGFVALFVLFPLSLVGQVSLEGHVLDSGSRKPLADAELYLYSQSKREYHVHSGQGGYFVFDSLSSGRYTLNVVHEGYHIFYLSLVLNKAEKTDLLLCPLGEHLHELKVIARPPTELSTSPTVKLDQLQIERSRGQNLSEMLKNTAGVYMLSSGAGIAKPVLRGMQGQRLVLINAGVRQEGQQWGDDHAPAIDPFATHGIELIKGAGSVQYGSDAIGGVIRVLPRPAKESPGIGGEFSINGFSNNRQLATSLLLEGRTKKNLYWRMQGSLRKAGDSKTPDYIISNTGFEEGNYSAEFGYLGKKYKSNILYTHISSRTAIFRGAHIGNSTDLLAAIESGRPYYIRPFTYKIGNPRQEVGYDMISLNNSYAFTAGTLSSSFSFQLNRRKEFDLINPIFSKNVNKPNYDLKLMTGIADIRFDLKKMGHWKGSIGYTHSSQSNDARGISFIIPNFLVRNNAIYLLEKYSKGRWFGEVGSRAEFRKLVTLQYVQLDLVREEMHFSNYALLAGAGYYFNDKLKTTLNLGRAFRTPAINELYSNGLHGGTATFEIGDKTLKSEYSYSADLSTEYLGRKLKLEASVFMNYMENYIYQQPDTQPTLTIRGAFPTLRFRQADALIKGFEFSSEYSFATRWKAALQLSALMGDNLELDRPLIYMPPPRVNFAILRELKNLGIFRNYQVKLSGTWTAKQTRFTDGEDYLPPPAAYFLLDLDIAGNIRMLKRDASLSLSLRNMLNNSYRDYLDRFRYFTDQPGFNAIIRLTIPFDIYKKHEKH